MARSGSATEWRVDFERRTDVCGKHGPFDSKHSDFGGTLGDHWTTCPACEAERIAEREEREKRKRHEEYIYRLISAAHIPPRFQGATFDNYEVITKGQRLALSVARQYAENFKDHKAVGRCMSQCGGLGTGKTHLGCAIVMTITRAGHSALYATASALIRRIRATWSGSHESEADVLREVQGVELLVIDEIGRSLGGDAEISQLEEIIDLRYQQTRPTLAISNYPFSEFPKYLGARGADRLRDNGGKIVVFDWQSYRGRQ